MQSVDNHVNTHTFPPNLNHMPLLLHADQYAQVSNYKQHPHIASFIMACSQHDTHVFPKSFSPKHCNQVLPSPHYTNSTRPNPSLEPIYPSYAIAGKRIDDNMRFDSYSYGVTRKRNDILHMGSNPSNIQERQRRDISHIMEEETLSQPLGPNNMYARKFKEASNDANMSLNSSYTQEERNFYMKKEEINISQSVGPLEHMYASNIKEIDDNMRFNSCSFGVITVKEDDSAAGVNSGTTQEEKKRDQDALSSHEFCRAGSFDVSTPTVQQQLGAHHDVDMLNFSSSVSNSKSEVITMESLNHANPPSRANSSCKAPKRPSKKKAHQKQILCVPLASGSQNKSPGECLHSDSWAWRKYGQKSIKGSPYPRGYYRCSSCKGCTARKQVERSHSDPNMLVITYTSGHNHTWQANHKNQPKLEDENSYSSNPCENFPFVDSSKQEGEKNHVQTLTTELPYDSILEGGDSPCIRGKYDVGNSQEGIERELDYFGLLEDLPSNSSLIMLESTKSPLSDHEDPITIVHSNVVDPFNLFNWSSNIGLNYYSTT